MHGVVSGVCGDASPTTPVPFPPEKKGGHRAQPAPALCPAGPEVAVRPTVPCVPRGFPANKGLGPRVVDSGSARAGEEISAPSEDLREEGGHPRPQKGAYLALVLASTREGLGRSNGWGAFCLCPRVSQGGGGPGLRVGNR